MKLLLAFIAFVAVAYSAPIIDEETPIIPISGGSDIISAPVPKIEININISINGVDTPYVEQNYVYIELRYPEQPPQIAVPGFDYIPDPNVFVPINDGGLIVPL